MAKLELTNKQLRLIQSALELYSRVGILQFNHTLDHPSIDSMIEKQFSPTTPLKVGDQTMRGEIVEISKKSIKTKGRWGGQEEVKEWFDLDKIKHSPDYEKVHETTDTINKHFSEIKKLISGREFGTNGSYGINAEIVDETCREAYDMVQVIRHEFWKSQKDKSDMVVSSSVCQTSKADLIKAEVEHQDLYI